MVIDNCYLIDSSIDRKIEIIDHSLRDESIDWYFLNINSIVKCPM